MIETPTQASLDTQADDPAARRRSRLQLLLVVALFFGSFAVAATLFFSGWRPAAQGRNFGELLAEPIDLNAHALLLDADGRWTWRNTEREWTALVRLPADCNDACWQRLDPLPNVRTSLGRHAPRLHMILLDRELPVARREALRPLRSAVATSPLPLPALPAEARAPELWLVDPHGYAVLRYPPGFDPRGLRKDLGKLLK
jgi:hypothetical protein